MSQPLDNAQIDAGLDAIDRARKQALAMPPSAERCARLAELAHLEASWWEALSERCRVRVHWRAALLAREHALNEVRTWQRRGLALAATEAACAVPTENAAA